MISTAYSLNNSRISVIESYQMTKSFFYDVNLSAEFT